MVVHASDASQVVFQKLEDMIASVKIIALATVQKADKEGVTNGCRYTIEVTEVLAGELPAKRLTVVYYEQGSPQFSVIVPASGIEHQLQEGRRYLFFFQSGAEQVGLGVVLTRAEPEERRGTVLKAWQQRQRREKNDDRSANHPLELTASRAGTRGSLAQLERAKSCEPRFKVANTLF